MKITPLSLGGACLIEPVIYKDERGCFFETYSAPKLSAFGIPVNFTQDNQSVSHKGVLRGLHFQNPPFDQGKLVRVVSGAVNDVIVDIRKNSPTYGKHLVVRLDAENKLLLWVPGGFAHGFVSLADETVFLYKVTNVYNKESESGIIWNDSTLAIDWGINSPLVSDKDLILGKFSDLNSSF